MVLLRSGCSGLILRYCAWQRGLAVCHVQGVNLQWAARAAASAVLAAGAKLDRTGFALLSPSRRFSARCSALELHHTGTGTRESSHGWWQGQQTQQKGREDVRLWTCTVYVIALGPRPACPAHL